MSLKTHEWFLEVASKESKRLEKAISLVGPIKRRPREKLLPSVHLCRSVVGQQLSGKAAESIWDKFLSLANGRDVLKFIQSTEIALLRECGLSAAKAKALKEISDAFLSGRIIENSLFDLDHIERSRQITSIWGIGQWTADMLNIFYFGEQDIWPEGDLAAVKTLEEFTTRKSIPAKFRPYRSILAMYMWKYRDSGLRVN